MYFTCIVPFSDEFGINNGKNFQHIHIKQPIPPFLSPDSSIFSDGAQFRSEASQPYSPHLVRVRPRMRASAQAS